MNTKLKKLGIVTAVMVPLFALQSFHTSKYAVHGGNPENHPNFRTSGAASQLGKDYTGSPLGSATCAGCHRGGTYTNVNSAIVVKNSSDQIVTSYLPGEQLTVELSVGADGNPRGFGGQLTVLTDQNSMAGSFLNVSSSNTQISNLGQVEYLEHNSRSSSGVFQATFKAPSAGTGAITLYGIGVAVNGDASSGSDNASSPVTLALTEDATTSVGDFERENVLKVYPNPSRSGVFNIEGEVVSFEVTDFSGKRVAEGNNAVVNISDLESGAYLLKVNLASGEILNQKIMK